MTQDAFTLVVDLRPPADEIFSRFKADTRKEIRKALRADALSHAMTDGSRVPIDQFLEDYRASPIKETMAVIAEDLVRVYYADASLIASSIHLPDGRVLNWHSYIKGERCVVLFQSFRAPGAGDVANALRGRANKLHHWLDLLAFRQAGFESYDFGGWYPYVDSPKMLNINRFKEEFGGTLVRKVNVRSAVTLRGKIVLMLLRLRHALSRDRRELAAAAKACKVV